MRLYAASMSRVNCFLSINGDAAILERSVLCSPAIVAGSRANFTARRT
jgi:hypothetical protein